MSATVATASYVFGIVSADTPLPAVDQTGPAAGLHLVAGGDLAALVGCVPLDRPLGRAADLRAHERVLADVVASGNTVLPMRFGAVLADDDAVAQELLERHRDEFRDALETLRGRVQYLLSVRYVQDAVLAEVLATHPEIRRFRDAASRRGPSAQLRLGQLMVQALEQLRPTDASALLTELSGAVDVRIRNSEAPDDVLAAAFLVDTRQRQEFEAHVEQVAARNAARMRFSMIGPSPAYDFVGDG